MSFNPNTTGTVGNEWRAYKKGSVVLTSSSLAAAALVASTATETIDSLMMPFTQSGAASSYGKLWAEVYNANDLGTLNEAVTEYTFVPNEDESIANIFESPSWSGPFNANGTVYTFVDDTVDESSDYLMMPNGATCRFDFNTAALAAGRVLYVTVEVRAFGYWGSSGLGLYCDLYNNTTFVARLGTIQPPTDSDDTHKNFQNFQLGPFYVNPLTEEPWLRSDITSFDSGTNLMIQLYSRGNNTAVAAVRLKVGMITEKRLALGGNTKATTPPTGTQTNNVCSLKTPAGVDNWAKTTSNSYLIVVRRLDDPQGAVAAMTTTIPYIDSGATNPHTQGTAYGITIDASGKLLTNTGAMTRAHPLLMATTGGALSADSQVYHTLLSGKVYSGVTSTQRVSNAASTTYGTIRAIVGVIGSPSAQLTAKIKRNSDNTQFGGDAPLTVAALSSQTWLGVADGITWYDCTLTLASNATLVSGTQYYIEFSSTTASGLAWYLRGLEYTETHAFTTDQSYGGSIDSATLEGVAYAQGDLAATTSTVATIPSAPPAPPGTPGSLSVYVVSYTLPDPGEPICDPGSHQVVRIAWGATSEGVLFDYYGIERSEDGGTTWTLIKRVQTESILTFDDVEAKRGVTLKYRIRVVRTTGQFGSYLTQSGTSICNANTSAVIFCTNQYPLLTTGYIRLGAEHEYIFLGDSEVSVVQMHGRDYQTVFRPTEDRGVKFDIPVLLFTKGEASTGLELPVGGKGIGAFDGLRAIVESDAPYTCVHTPDGERVFASLRLPSGRRSEPASFYAATITAIQVSATPSVVD